MSRAPRGYTSERCHGCGSTEPHRPGDVCRTCRAMLAEAQAARAALAARTDLVPVVVPGQPHWLPWVAHQREYCITNPLHQLATLLSTAPPEYADPGKARQLFKPHAHSRGDGPRVRLMDPAVADVVAALWDAANEALNAAHAEGFDAGRNLLLGLASGSITNDKFNETAARITGSTDAED